MASFRFTTEFFRCGATMFQPNYRQGTGWMWWTPCPTRRHAGRLELIERISTPAHCGRDLYGASANHYGGAALLEDSEGAVPIIAPRGFFRRGGD